MVKPGTYVSKAGTTYTFVKDAAGAYKARDHLLNHKVIGYDTETTGLDPHVDKVIMAQFSSKEHTYVLDTRDINLLRIMTPVLESDEITKVEHNGGFDYQMTKGTIDVDTEAHMDLMLGERALTAGLQFDGFSLGAVTEKYLGIKRDKSLQKSFIGHKGEFSHDQIEYGADDTSYLLTIGKKMQEKAKADGVLKVWQIENAALPAFGDIAYYGQKIDKEKWLALMDFNRAGARQARFDLDKWFLPIVGTDLFGASGVEYEGMGGAAINYNSQPAVLHALQMMGIKIDGETIKSTDKKTQKKISDHGAIRALTDYRSAEKLLGTYGQSYLNAIHAKTGRVHPKFNQYGTESGRPTCKKPNFLNIPRKKEFRDAFVTDEDRLVSTVDYTAAELMILAELSGDRLMIDGFNSGIDFHCYVASLLFGVEVTKTNENKKWREPTKQLNFGIAYGMGAFSLYEKLKYELKQNITFEECEKLFYGYKKTFKTAIGFLDAQKRIASTKFEMTNINGRKRYWFKPDPKKIRAAIESELTKKGRLRLTEEMEEQIPELLEERVKMHLSAVQREGANNQIQSVNADFTKVSMARIRKEFKKRRWDSRMYNSVYDEIVMDSHKSCAQEAHELQKKIMVDSANEMLKKVHMKVEGHLTTHWTK